jgi:Spy/CpxP family protein refolding chaperone
MTNRFARRVLVLLVFAGLAGADLSSASQAQQSFFWWRSDEFKAELGLTPEQAAKIESIHQSTLPELRQEWDELNKYEAKLSKLLESSTDEAVLARQIDRVETARANLNKTRSLMLARIRLVLNAEQRVRFKMLADRRQNARPSDPGSRRRPDGGNGSRPPERDSTTRPGC